MNKNTRKRKNQYHKDMKKQGFPTPGFKKKVKPFPVPSKDADMSIRAQMQTLGWIPKS